MEASTVHAGRARGRPRIGIGFPLLRVRSDPQLVALFRAGNNEAFRVIHDRYRPRLLAYMRQMLAGRSADVEDALQDVFVRAYAALRSNDRELILRPWLYRVAHNRCIDELRRCSAPFAAELLETSARLPYSDPVAETEQRESLRRLITDIGRLPEQQRSALLMRELAGMSYIDVAEALGVSVPAVKSLLTRARIGLAQALEARTVACTEIRRQLAEAHGRGVRPSWMARRHLRDCPECRACRAELRALGRELGALSPTLGPLGLLAKLFGAGTGASGSTAAGAGGTASASAGGVVSGAVGITSSHVAALVAATVVTAGGALELQQTVTARHAPVSTRHAHRVAATVAPTGTPAAAPVAATGNSKPASTSGPAAVAKSQAATSTAQPSAAQTSSPAQPTGVAGKPTSQTSSTPAQSTATQSSQTATGTLLCETIQLTTDSNCPTGSTDTTSTTGTNATDTNTGSSNSTGTATSPAAPDQSGTDASPAGTSTPSLGS